MWLRNYQTRKKSSPHVMQLRAVDNHMIEIFIYRLTYRANFIQNNLSSIQLAFSREAISKNFPSKNFHFIRHIHMPDNFPDNSLPRSYRTLPYIHVPKNILAKSIPAPLRKLYSPFLSDSHNNLSLLGATGNLILIISSATEW